MREVLLVRERERERERERKRERERERERLIPKLLEIEKEIVREVTLPIL